MKKSSGVKFLFAASILSENQSQHTPLNL